MCCQLETLQLELATAQSQGEELRTKLQLVKEGQKTDQAVATAESTSTSQVNQLQAQLQILRQELDGARKDLESQNDALRRSRADAEALRDAARDLQNAKEVLQVFAEPSSSSWTCCTRVTFLWAHTCIHMPRSHCKFPNSKRMK